MRLRLVVKRHNLPDAAIIWLVEAAHDLTVSQLLEQLNEIIPLESSGEWGLEDYAVEVTGFTANFECLHFQLVKSILHEDDEVIIRPLLTQDLKQRRLSGRHQITSDGRHLFDGFSFGRPRPRGGSDRPAITIPPRKRRRILYGEEDEESTVDGILAIGSLSEVVENVNGNRELVIRTEFEDDDEDDDQEEDEDFEPDEEEEAEDVSGDGSDVESHENSTDEEELSDGDKNMEVERHDGAIMRLQSAFPKAPPSIIERILLSCGGDLNQAWVSLSRGFKPATNGEIGDISHQASSPRKTRSARNKSAKRKHSEAHEDEVENDIELHGDDFADVDEGNVLIGYYDQHGLPDGSIISGQALSKMAEIANPKSIVKVPGQTASKKARSLSVASNRSVRFEGDDSAPDAMDMSDVGKDLDEDEHLSTDELSSSTGSSDSSIESSEDDTSLEESDSTSSSDSDGDSSSSDSDSQPEETSSKANGTVSGHLAEAGNNQNTVSNDPLPVSKTVPPGQGQKSTKSRNQRRRTANLLQRFKDKGITPAGTTAEQFKLLDKSALETPEAAEEALTLLNMAPKPLKSAEKASRAEADAAVFEAKRKALLASLASGGVELTTTGRSHLLKPTISDAVATDREMADVMQPVIATEIPETALLHEYSQANKTDTKIVNSEAVIDDTPLVSTGELSTSISEAMNEDSTPRRRTRLDLGAGRRLLFGALGIRAPKTKKDEEKIRNDLMKQVRPLKAVTSTGPQKDINEEESPEDPDEWRKHITLRSVECCHEGIELSEPPFPFVQRWDPQQQGGYFQKAKRGGKGKKSLRNQPQYYEERQESLEKRKRNDSYQDDYYDPYEQSFFTEPAANGTEIWEHEDGSYSSSVHMQRGYSDPIEEEVNDQIMRDVQEAGASKPDDLPVLPTDIFSLPGLNLDNVMIGMTIAFKQLIMSEATNWQPVVSDYRTAVVIVVSENGELELRLAKRDRMRSERYYDDETGERIYGKFDMPDDEEENEDDGHLAITFAELIEPRLVQLPPEPLTNDAAGESFLEMFGSHRDESKTLSNEELLGDVQKESVDSSSADDEIGASLVIEGDNLSIRGGDLSLDYQEISTNPITMDAGNKPSTIIKEASLASGIPSSVPQPSPQFQQKPGRDNLGQLAKDMVGTDGLEDPFSSPTFHGLSSSLSHREGLLPVIIEQTVTEIYGGEPAGSELISTSNGLDTKPSLSSVASQVTDHGRQPDFSTAGNDTLERFGDIDSFLQGDEGSLVNEPQAPGTTEQDDALDLGLSQTSYHNPVLDDMSDANLPSLDEVFSTAYSSIGPKHENFVPQPLSSVVDHDKSYNEAMAALDAQLDVADDPDQLAPKGSKTKKNSPFKIPAGSQQVDLTFSSENERGSDAEKENDEDYYDKSSLSRQPEFVKKRRGPRRRTGGSSIASSQNFSQDSGRRSSRRKSAAKI